MGWGRERVELPPAGDAGWLPKEKDVFIAGKGAAVNPNDGWDGWWKVDGLVGAELGCPNPLLLLPGPPNAKPDPEPVADD